MKHALLLHEIHPAAGISNLLGKKKGVWVKNVSCSDKNLHWWQRRYVPECRRDAPVRQLFLPAVILGGHFQAGNGKPGVDFLDLGDVRIGDGHVGWWRDQHQCSGYRNFHFSSHHGYNKRQIATC